MSAKIALSAFVILGCILPALYTQEQPAVTIRPRASEDIILAVADVQAASPEKAAEISDALKSFNQVLWNDLSFSGFFTLAGKSFYPPQPIVRPEQDLRFDAWEGLGFKVSFLTVGTLNLKDGVLTAFLKRALPGRRNRCALLRIDGRISSFITLRQEPRAALHPPKSHIHPEEAMQRRSTLWIMTGTMPGHSLIMDQTICFQTGRLIIPNWHL
jgi:hypothetical protein